MHSRVVDTIGEGLVGASMVVNIVARRIRGTPLGIVGLLGAIGRTFMREGAGVMMRMILGSESMGSGKVVSKEDNIEIGGSLDCSRVACI